MPYKASVADISQESKNENWHKKFK